MMFSSNLDKYLHRYSVYEGYPLYGGEMADLDQIVVIPALAEKEALFHTLASLARNREDELKHSLVLCVINNRPSPFATTEDVRNNLETMMIMKDMIKGDLSDNHLAGTNITALAQEILARPLRLAFIDASSSGRELPRKGGVGHARKIGMDRALTLLDPHCHGKKWIFCLDADTLVEPNYLSALRNHFERFSPPGAVVAFSHRIPEDRLLAAGICCYEIFLRYYVLGLGWAGSPYAFHTIGSTMACTAAAYTAVRGMPCRQAGEDFYFLNKLVKIAPLGDIRGTTVYPSARPSGRVPFGTGRRMQRFLAGAHNEYLVYDPGVFAILKAWLEEFAREPGSSGNNLLARAASISPQLHSFLDRHEFAAVWERIRSANRRHEYLTRQFHGWFDGFKTLKLIHELSADAFPPIHMFKALKILFQQMNVTIAGILADNECRTLDEQMLILDFLRRGSFTDL
ncbi:MAG: glycosyltransferase family 2 protein [Deltaproteobacteria bacterium]|nr:glycosyltransferase family 2 protein [Deltaproteobacteria bacterium]